MDELALRTLLNSLEASRSSLHGLLHIFTGFVVVGLGFDLFVIIKEFQDDWGEFRYGQIHPHENHLPKRPSASLLILALLGTALIVTGVAGELYVDVEAGKIETQIREANDKLLGLIIQEAGEARASAQIAESAATESKQTVGNVKKEADDLLQKYLETSREVAKYAWRTVSPEQLKILRHQLQTVRGSRVVVRWNTADPEQDNFGMQLSDALGKAGLVVNRVPAFGAIISGGDFPRRIAPSISLEDVTKDNSDLEKVLANALVIASLAKYPVPTGPPGNIIISGKDLKVVVGPRNPN